MELFGYRSIGGNTLSSRVQLDATVETLAAASDYSFDGQSTFTVPYFEVPSDFTLGVIYGPSGTGKSTLLKEFGEIATTSWDPSKAVASQVDYNLLMRLGLSSIPSLCRPYHVLSNGEKHRADIAMTIGHGCVIDEFTSVCHRELAQSISIGLKKVIDQHEYKNVVIATCHEDVIKWLQPDWVANTLTGQFQDGRLERPCSRYDVVPCSSKAWSIFSDHHYLSSEINKSAHCWLMIKDNEAICGFAASLAFPNRAFNNAWKGHRTVILPDFQGMGLGSKLSDTIAQLHLDRGLRYFSKTAHPKLGAYRDRSPLWRPTSKNGISRKDYLSSERSGKYKNKAVHASRVCFSHEYVGSAKSSNQASKQREQRERHEQVQLTLF